MISAEALTNARSRILAEFLRAVKGPPTQVVQTVDSEAAALGQHLKGSRPQRGLHGTAAAIQVLSSGHTEGNAATHAAIGALCRPTPRN